MTGAISVVNGGSSSIKFSLYRETGNDGLRQMFRGQVDGIGVAPQFVAKSANGDTIDTRTWPNSPEYNHESLMAYIIDWIRDHRQAIGLDLLGVGHRVVHGGNDFSSPVKVDNAILDKLETLIPLAPLHQPHNIGPIKTVAKRHPGISQVACFDTAFHTTNPKYARLFALPRDLIREGVYRYGFHGLSYEYISRRMETVDPEAAKGRVVVAHLGSGASMCGLLEGRSIANSMGFTAIEGLVMGTRAGSLDPGVVLYLMQNKQMDAAALEEMLYKRSGLLGLSEISNDMRILLESDDERAKEAVEVFIYRIQRELGATAAALGGLDALVFTAGIGENSAQIRANACAGMEWLGIRLDEDANRAGGPRISTDDSRVKVWVIPTNEELMIATHTQQLLVGNISNG